MKGVLLDSHVLLWGLQEPHKIGMQAKRYWQEAPEVYVSLASIWELGMKHAKGKLAFSAAELLDTFDALGIALFPITSTHVVAATEVLELAHYDPFDRMLVAQAQADGLTLLTADKVLLASGLAFVIDVRK